MRRRGIALDGTRHNQIANSLGIDPGSVDAEHPRPFKRSKSSNENDGFDASITELPLRQDTPLPIASLDLGDHESRGADFDEDDDDDDDDDLILDEEVLANIDRLVCTQAASGANVGLLLPADKGDAELGSEPYSGLEHFTSPTQHEFGVTPIRYHEKEALQKELVQLRNQLNTKVGENVLLRQNLAALDAESRKATVAHAKAVEQLQVSFGEQTASLLAEAERLKADVAFFQHTQKQAEWNSHRVHLSQFVDSRANEVENSQNICRVEEGDPTVSKFSDAPTAHDGATAMHESSIPQQNLFYRDHLHLPAIPPRVVTLLLKISSKTSKECEPLFIAITQGKKESSLISISELLNNLVSNPTVPDMHLLCDLGEILLWIVDACPLSAMEQYLGMPFVFVKQDTKSLPYALLEATAHCSLRVNKLRHAASQTSAFVNENDCRLYTQAILKLLQGFNKLIHASRKHIRLLGRICGAYFSRPEFEYLANRKDFPGPVQQILAQWANYSLSAIPNGDFRRLFQSRRTLLGLLSKVLEVSMDCIVPETFQVQSSVILVFTQALLYSPTSNITYFLETDPFLSRLLSMLHLSVGFIRICRSPYHFLVYLNHISVGSHFLLRLAQLSTSSCRVDDDSPKRKTLTFTNLLLSSVRATPLIMVHLKSLLEFIEFTPQLESFDALNVDDRISIRSIISPSSKGALLFTRTLDHLRELGRELKSAHTNALE
jgi:hypothetical protein